MARAKTPRVVAGRLAEPRSPRRSGHPGIDLGECGERLKVRDMKGPQGGRGVGSRCQHGGELRGELGEPRTDLRRDRRGRLAIAEEGQGEVRHWPDLGRRWLLVHALFSRSPRSIDRWAWADDLVRLSPIASRWRCRAGIRAVPGCPAGHARQGAGGPRSSGRAFDRRRPKRTVIAAYPRVAEVVDVGLAGAVVVWKPAALGGSGGCLTPTPNSA